MNKTEIIVSLIVAVLGGTGLNGIITHILYNSKLKKEQKMQAKNIIFDKIVNALEEIRKIEVSIRTQEIFNLEDIFESEKYTDFLEDNIVCYPAIMNSFDTFFEFFNKVNTSRETFAPYIDPEVGAYLYYMQNYAIELMEYIKKNNLPYPFAGCFIFQDLLNWQTHLEELIVRRLNKLNYKLYPEHGKQWEKKKKKVKDILRKKSILYKLINDADDRNIVTIKNII